MDGRDVRPVPPGGAAPVVVAERYRLERSLGNGGMGEVFVATDLMLDRRVALKRLSTALAQDEPARKRFLREAKALARINHPNVVGVFDTGEDAGTPFLVMELVEGTTLRDELRRNGRIEPTRAASIGAGIAGGLAAAHSQGVVHRDVKPSNVFLTGSDVPKVGDFGIARVERGDATLTLTGQAFGSPPYVAPEQATGGHVDARADLYSLGCVLFQMLAGRRPFDGDDPVSLTYQHVHTVPPRLDALDPGVPADMAILVAALLEKDPADRPKTAEEVRRALEGGPMPQPAAAVPTEPIVEAPTSVLPSRTQTLENRRKRRWPLAAAIAGVIVLLALGLAAFLTRSNGAAAPSTPPATTTSPPATTSLSASASFTSTSVPALTPDDAGAALVTLAQQMQDAGAIDKHLEKDVEHAVEDALQHSDGTDEAVRRLDDLRGSIAESVNNGDVSSDDAQQLYDAIDQLEQAIRSSGGNATR
jgi:eukaryotic-like serine/threonine-protein kinase